MSGTQTIIPLKIHDAKLAAWLMDGKCIASPPLQPAIIVYSNHVAYWAIDPDAWRMK